MFFPERIKSIKQTDRVLEIGPGSTPHPRADIFLEKVFTDSVEFRMQRGNTPELQTEKPIVQYESDVFPFRDKEFDYVICSHVLEHVPDAGNFLNEVTRVAKKGYLEYPTIYYDYLYNFSVHTLFLMYKNGAMHWMKKSESGLNEFNEVQHFFYESFTKEHYYFADNFREYLFQGFEWEGDLKSLRVHSIKDVCYERSDIIIKKMISERKNINKFQSMKHSIKKLLKI